MELKKLHIRNFKSLVNVEINEPNPFTVFVGPNGSGKSNIFEALEFLNSSHRFGLNETYNLFGGASILSYQYEKKESSYTKLFPVIYDPSIAEDKEILPFDSGVFIQTKLQALFTTITFNPFGGQQQLFNDLAALEEKKFFIDRFSRIFVGKSSLRKQNTFTDVTLNIDASNIENVLKRILLLEKEAGEEIIEQLQLLIPEFEKIEVKTSSLSGQNELAVYEKYLKKPLNKNLISDGTYNILSLLTALYQSNDPQFICIEEPENGLHPFAIKQLVTLFRQQCEEKGHYIWLNTHSQTLVSELRSEEIITVNKENGETRIRQHKGADIYKLTMDEAWLSNALGGGVPW